MGTPSLCRKYFRGASMCFSLFDRAEIGTAKQRKTHGNPTETFPKEENVHLSIKGAVSQPKLMSVAMETLTCDQAFFFRGA